MPIWLLKFLKKRRENKFLAAFPDAVDTIVRGIKAGTAAARQHADHLHRSAGAAARRIPLHHGDAGDRHADRRSLRKLYERIPIPEANFFGIVIAIQQKAGGNLSEALGNLSQACCANARR